MCDRSLCTGRISEGSYCKDCSTNVKNGRCKCGEIGQAGQSSDCPYTGTFIVDTKK